MKTLHFFIICLLITLVNNLNAQNKPILYSFFVAGHTYGRPGAEKVGLYPLFTQKFNYIQQRQEIKFGVFTGDIVASNPTALDWDIVDADLDSLGLPVYFAVGNHDMENRELFENRYGKTYYRFLYENDLFIVLDPNLDNWNISGKQLSFLNETLDLNLDEIDNVFIFFHQVLWWKENSIYTDYRPNSFEGKADTINYWSAVEPILRQTGKPVYIFAGDFGAGSWSADFMFDKYQNISLIGSGMGEGIGDNFVVANVHSDKTLNFDLICLNDTVPECFGDFEDYLLSNSLHSFKADSVNIYPNPSNNKFFVEVYSHKDENIKFVLRDIYGKRVMQNNIRPNSRNMMQSNLKSGVYFYQVQQSGSILKSGKLIILN